MTESTEQILLCLNTCPNREVAQQVAESLVAKHLAACVNIVPNIHSIYKWQGNIESDDEVLLLIKTTRACYTALQTALLETHPYELPELIAVSLSAGLPAYLNWVAQETGKQ